MSHLIDQLRLVHIEEIPLPNLLESLYTNWKIFMLHSFIRFYFCVVITVRMLFPGGPLPSADETLFNAHHMPLCPLRAADLPETPILSACTSATAWPARRIP